METYEMRTMFTLNMEGLHLRLHQFGVLLSQLCPRLDAHLNEHSIHTAMYASQWYLTLFAYSFPISLVLRIYDLVFAEGAVETITRVAVAIMQKNEDTLCEIDDFEQLMMYLSSRKLYEVAYGSDPEAVISDAMGLSTIITKQKMDSISEAYYREIEQEKTRAQQVLAIRFGSWGIKTPTSPTTNKRPTHNKRDSWFSWGGAAAAVDSPASNRRESNASTTPSSLTTSQTDMHQPQDHLLHAQIEDLVTALSQLQKENTRISEDLMAKQMKEMDLMAEREQLLARNAKLESSLKQTIVDDQPSPVESVDGDTIVEIGDENKLKNLQNQAEFRGFVESLKLSGDFGTLIAGALTSSQQTLPVGEAEEVSVSDRSITHHEIKEQMTNANEFDEVTSELVSIKLANFEMGLKYQNLCQEHEQLLKNLNSTTEGQVDLVNKIMTLQNTIESLQADKEQLMQELETVLEENQELNQKTLATKKTCSDLQLEKMEVDNECKRLKDRVKELEDQRREYLMPRGSFTEEVFAAHQTLFGSKPEAPAMNRRHTVQMTCGVNEYDDTYQKKYIESDLRCRELEKLLAETKFRLVEYEATVGNGGISNTSSPRGSLQQNRRTSAIQTKRSSLSMLVKVNSTNSGTSGPHSPPYTDSRESTDSLRSTTSSSSHQQKRSSVYSRFLNALGTGPLTEEAQEITEEPRHLV
jgi:regulator of replication initiation timing